MAVTNPLSDTLAAAASSIGGLLSQMEGALGNGLSSKDLFSNLLSQNANVDASLSATQTTTSKISTSSAFASNNQSSITSSPDSLMQTLENLAANLRKALAQLHQQNNDASNNTAQQNQTAQNKNTQDASTETPNSNVQTTVVAQNNTDASSQDASQNSTSAPGATSAQNNSQDSTSLPTSPPPSTTTDSPSTEDKKTLTDILAELLMLTQMVMKNLQQTQATSGVATASTSQATTTITTSPKTASSPLEQLVAALEKTTEALQEVATNKNSTDTSSVPQTTDFSLLATGLQQALSGDTASASKTIDAFDVTAQLAALSAKLKSTLTNLQTQNKTSTSASTQAPTVIVPLSASGGAPIKNLSTAVDTQSQILSVPVPPTTQNTTTSSATQTLTAGEAMTISVDKGDAGNTTDFGTGSDMLGGNKNAPSFNSNANITAGGAQASGTYNFASTLSAARATNGGTVGLPTVVDQVILQMNRSVKNGNDQMSLQLQPGDLGKITVKLDFGSDGKVQGTVTAENPQTLSLLQKDSRSLERALQDAGLRADPGSLQFNLGGQAGQNSGQMANNGGNANNAAGNGTVSANALSDDGGLVDISTIAETYYITPSGVNIQV